jgi:hypothetical protein
MAATGNSCFWLAYLKKSSSLKPLGQMNWNLVGTNQKQEWPVVAMFVNGSGRNEQSLETTFHSFLQIFISFDWGVRSVNTHASDWLISKNSPLKPLGQMNWNLVGSIIGRKLTDDTRRTTDHGRRTASDGKSSHCLLQGELKRTKGQNKYTKH